MAPIKSVAFGILIHRSQRNSCFVNNNNNNKNRKDHTALDIDVFFTCSKARIQC